MLNSSPASAKIDVLRSLSSFSTSVAWRRQRAGVDANADAFEVGENRDRAAARGRGRQPRAPARSSIGSRCVGKLQRQVGALAREIENALDGHLREGQGLDALAADFVLRQRLVAELLEHRRLEILARFGRVDQVAREHRVEREAGELNAVAREDDGIGFEVVADFRDRRVLEDRPQDCERGLAVERRAAAEPFVSERHVACLAGAVENTRPIREARTHDGPSATIRKAKRPAARQRLRQLLELLEARDRDVVLLDRRRGGRELGDQRAEAELANSA